MKLALALLFVIAKNIFCLHLYGTDTSLSENPIRGPGGRTVSIEFKVQFAPHVTPYVLISYSKFHFSMAKINHYKATVVGVTNKGFSIIYETETQNMEFGADVEWLAFDDTSDFFGEVQYIEEYDTGFLKEFYKTGDEHRMQLKDVKFQRTYLRTPGVAIYVIGASNDGIERLVSANYTDASPFSFTLQVLAWHHTELTYYKFAILVILSNYITFQIFFQIIKRHTIKMNACRKQEENTYGMKSIINLDLIHGIRSTYIVIKTSVICIMTFLSNMKIAKTLDLISSILVLLDMTSKIISKIAQNLIQLLEMLKQPKKKQKWMQVLGTKLKLQELNGIMQYAKLMEILLAKESLLLYKKLQLVLLSLLCQLLLLYYYQKSLKCQKNKRKSKIFDQINYLSIFQFVHVMQYFIYQDFLHILIKQLQHFLNCQLKDYYSKNHKYQQNRSYSIFNENLRKKNKILHKIFQKNTNNQTSSNKKSAYNFVLIKYKPIYFLLFIIKIYQKLLN
ncbi:H-type lectin domain protein (macronuclear) [Tetrahymena thermophila SB210]|uniref:H-type lectin domain protein n=1 Tax=Tetrahymena thermophila (strain SB210) TaxID=312017 RepID=Q22LN9_TETTS|nr:H-type lectin domain protein [Tetrahymena thermophila SB210]EAR86227.2 H-type lectin domain protein [Tetrahymena thermophila SB210]|eukprot:XP_976822.2 H-type lectin domain protein [Tetrahymena thermophila SB210]